MSRAMSSAFETAITGSVVHLAVFVMLDLSSGVLRFTSRAEPITWDGFTWLGGAAFTRLQPVEEGVSPRAEALALSISGIDPAYVASIMTEHYQGRAAKIWIATLDPDTQAVIADPLLVFHGRIDEPTVELSRESATITLTLESRWADWDRPRLKYFSDADQQAEHPGDLFFQFTAAMVNKEIAWGQYRGPAAPRVNVPNGAKQFLVNPYLWSANKVRDVLRRLF